jgi:hypothetical protein
MTVEEDHVVAVDAENHASFHLSARYGRTDLAQALPDRPARGHAERPTKFDPGDVPPDDPAILVSETEQSLADRKASRRRFIEARGRPLHRYPFMQ